jgi:mRNA interferase RelE/StbE
VPARKYDVRKISGRENTYRVRISSLRVIYVVDWSEKTVFVIKTQKRKGNTYLDI